ncbi:MAG: NAD-dependent epimerase/dehydratase family protein [Candidatus Latescibacterota bacterium]|nr:NAD-dependent epimerase/dehydratase family protein [Candidatus Latescibacterota bacterium]
MKVLVTGAGGFIGSHLSARLLDEGADVTGIDNINDYYSIKLKRDRLARLTDRECFCFREGDIAQETFVDEVFREGEFTHVVNLAAQAGVPYSLEQPRKYIQANVVGFLNILEASHHSDIRHLVYASSSSVYGLNETHPSAPTQNTEHPVSLYAATKKSNEMMAHAYSHLFGLPTTGLRFFTVYGPWGRPDMAVFIFVKAIIDGNPIDVFDGGAGQRSFTYVDDVVEGITRIANRAPEPRPGWSGNDPDPSSSSAPYRIYNIGNDETVTVNRIIEGLEKIIGKKAIRNDLPERRGDVRTTFADISALKSEIGYRPTTRVSEGLASFVGWYREYFGV